MTRREFLIKLKELKDKGYSKNFKDDETINSDGTHEFYKVIEYADDKYGDRRAINQVILKVYNFEKYADRVPEESYYSFEPIIMFSRDTEERIDLHIHYPKHSIEFIERKARQFGEWCKQYMNE